MEVIDLKLAMASAGCMACGKLKDRRRVICWGCHAVLPDWMKRELRHGVTVERVQRVLNRLEQMGRVKRTFKEWQRWLSSIRHTSAGTMSS